MKKILLLISLFVGVNIAFAQTVTLSFPEIDVSSLTGGEEILVPITVSDIAPAGSMISTFQLSVRTEDAYLTWNGTNTAPAGGVPFVHPNLTPLGADWLWNNNFPNELAYSWTDNSFIAPALVAPGEVLMTLSYTYVGGLPSGVSSEITIGFDKKMNTDGNQMAKITSEMYDENFVAYAMTIVPGHLTNGGGPLCDPGEWTGMGDGTSWFDPFNWCNDVLPDAATNVVIDSPTKANVVISGGVASTASLTLMAGSSLVVDYDGGLTTNGLFTNDGMFTIESENANGYAGTYIDLGGIAGTGMFQFNRQLFCTGTSPGVADPTGWHYLAAPFDGFTSDDLYDYFVNSWDQTTGMWMQMSMDPVLFPCTQWPTTPLATMDAWSLNFDVTYPDLVNCPLLPPGTGSQVEFMGAAADVHSGLHSTPLGYGAAGYQMWNMVGNPYPSGLDLDAVSFGPNTVQGAAFYDGCVGNYEYWSSATPGINNNVAPTLGFMVQTTAADAFTVDNADRAHGADWFWKGDISSLLILEATGNDKSDKLYVRFMDGVTPGFDLNGDFNKMFATTEGLPQIYTTAGENQLAINALPATEVVPMGFTANANGTYTISKVEASEFSEIYLEDLVTNEITDLLAGSYTFDYTTGTTADRFLIHFGALGVDDMNAANVMIWSHRNDIMVQAPSVNGEIVVYNMMGQEVVRTDIAPGVNVIPMDDVNTYYVVKVLTSDHAVTGKVFIK